MRVVEQFAWRMWRYTGQTALRSSFCCNCILRNFREQMVSRSTRSATFQF